MVLPLMLGLCLSGAVRAQSAAPGSPGGEDEALLQRLERSGAFDQAVERTIQRLTRKQAEARQQAQEEARARRREMAKNARPVDAARDHIHGERQAPVSIIEYSDFECPFCKRFLGVPEEVVKRLGGKVNFVWRHFPLEMHAPLAVRAAEATECAARLGGNDAFWSYTNAAMTRTRSNGQGLPPGEGDPLLALAAELKLDAAAFGKCLESGEMRARVTEDLKDGEGAGITGTPGIVLRHTATGKSILAEGAISADALEKGVRELLPAQ
mgnify:CR=1 FL=1